MYRVNLKPNFYPTRQKVIKIIQTVNKKKSLKIFVNDYKNTDLISEFRKIDVFINIDMQLLPKDKDMFDSGAKFKPISLNELKTPKAYITVHRWVEAITWVETGKNSRVPFVKWRNLIKEYVLEAMGFDDCECTCSCGKEHF